MPKQRVGDGGGGGGGGVSVPSQGITFFGPVEIVVQDGITINVYPEQKRVEFLIGFSGEAHGDIMFRGASGWQRLAAGGAGLKLTTNGAGADPTWT